MGTCRCGCGEITPRYKRTRKYLGHVEGEHAKYCPGHNSNDKRNRERPRYKEQDLGYNSPCWIWLWSYGYGGYGQYNGKKAHKTIYENLHGKVEKGLHLDHLCRVRACVNPDHMEPVTPAVNAQRGEATKASPEIVKAIRKEYIPYKVTLKDLGEKYGLKEVTVFDIIKRKTWNNVIS